MPALRKKSLLVLFLVVFTDLLGFGMVLPLLPIYADHFTVDEHGWQLGLLMASFSIMQFFFAPVWGRLSDHIGRRPVLMVGLLGSVVFYTLFGIATVMQSLPLMFVSRVGAGIFGATISTAHAYIADSTSLENRPRGMALIGLGFGMGFTFGPLLGFLAVPTGYGDPGPWPGYVAAMLSAVGLVLAYFVLPESKRPDSQPAVPRLFDTTAVRQAVMIPSIGMLLIAIFVCIFSFASFETTLSLLIKGRATEMVASESTGGPAPTPVEGDRSQPFRFAWGQVCLTYAFIGFTLALVQGGIVRRLGGRVPEGVLATGGAVGMVAGFLLMLWAIQAGSVPWLFVSLAVVVAGFSFMQPNLNSLLSRRSDPARQGMVMGLGQSVNALARIAGSALGIPLLRWQLEVPYYTAAILMLLGALLVTWAARRGADYEEVG